MMCGKDDEVLTDGTSVVANSSLLLQGGSATKDCNHSVTDEEV